MHIDYLANHLDIVPIIAQWYYDEWAHLVPGRTLEQTGESIARRAGTDRIPLSLVAFEGEELIGTASTATYDMDGREDLSPWLVGVYIRDDWRGKGVGTQLVQAIERCMAEIGVPKLYLYTLTGEAFYLKLGWTVTERTVYQGCDVVIMEKSFSASWP